MGFAERTFSIKYQQLIELFQVTIHIVDTRLQILQSLLEACRTGLEQHRSQPQMSARQSREEPWPINLVGLYLSCI